MDTIKLTNHILNNDLSETQLIKIIRGLKQDNFQHGYRRGYWARDADLKKIRNVKNKRIKKEQEIKQLNQDK